MALAGYAVVAAASSTMSVVWHARREPRDWSFHLDYFLAALWFVAEVGCALLLGSVSDALVVAAANGVAVYSNKLADRAGSEYEAAHAVWHLFNVAKSVFSAWWIVQLAGCGWGSDGGW